MDDWEKAAKHLGRALHPLQDWVAHGDLNRRKESPYASSAYGNLEPYKYIHNLYTTQNGRDGKSPDDAALDSTGSDGRSTINVLKFGVLTGVGDRLYWATFNPETNRIQLAEEKTKAILLDFLVHVRKNSKDCGGCRQAFLRYFDKP